MLKPLQPEEAHALIDRGEAIFVDIRSEDEYRAEKIAGAECLAIADIDKLKQTDKAIIFHCLSGMRTNQQAQDLASLLEKEAFVLAGGLHGWQNAGLPTEKVKGAVMPLQQQVMLTIGLLLLAATVATFTVSHWFALAILAIGGGLIMAGLTGFCGLARLLMLMPWNRPQPS